RTVSGKEKDSGEIRAWLGDWPAHSAGRRLLLLRYRTSTGSDFSPPDAVGNDAGEKGTARQNRKRDAEVSSHAAGREQCAGWRAGRCGQLRRVPWSPGPA